MVSSQTISGLITPFTSAITTACSVPLTCPTWTADQRPRQQTRRGQLLIQSAQDKCPFCIFYILEGNLDTYFFKYGLNLNLETTVQKCMILNAEYIERSSIEYSQNTSRKIALYRAMVTAKQPQTVQRLCFQGGKNTMETDQVENVSCSGYIRTTGWYLQLYLPLPISLSTVLLSYPVTPSGSNIPLFRSIVCKYAGKYYRRLYIQFCLLGRYIQGG